MQSEDKGMGVAAGALTDCAEYLEAIIASSLEGGCGWPDSQQEEFCSNFCDQNGCAKMRSHHCRVALAKLQGA